MTAQSFDLGDVYGVPTILRHFGCDGAAGQVDIVLAQDSRGDTLYQINDGKYTDLTSRVQGSVLAAYEQALGNAPNASVFV